jgi:hypothetical protein
MQLTLLTIPTPAPMTAAATAFFVRPLSATTAGGLHTPGAPLGGLQVPLTFGIY